jgi:hypothetical protein
MTDLKTRIDILRRQLKIANTIKTYKQKYAECRPECVHFLINSYAQNEEFINLFEEYLFCPEKYSTESVEKELKETIFKYTCILHSELIESKDPINTE